MQETGNALELLTAENLQQKEDLSFLKGVRDAQAAMIMKLRTQVHEATYSTKPKEASVTIKEVSEVCDSINGNCHACPFMTPEGCPFLSDDPMNWDDEYLSRRYINSIHYTKEQPIKPVEE